MQLTAENVSAIYTQAASDADIVILPEEGLHAWKPTIGMTFEAHTLLSNRENILVMMAQLSPGCRESVTPDVFSARADGSIWGDDFATLQLLCLMFALGFVRTAVNHAGQPVVAIRAEYYRPWLVQDAAKSDIDASSESASTEGG